VIAINVDLEDFEDEARAKAEELFAKQKGKISFVFGQYDFNGLHHALNLSGFALALLDAGGIVEDIANIGYTDDCDRLLKTAGKYWR
jgi:hypothetical protein